MLPTNALRLGTYLLNFKYCSSRSPQISRYDSISSSIWDYICYHDNSYMWDKFFGYHLVRKKKFAGQFYTNVFDNFAYQGNIKNSVDKMFCSMQHLVYNLSMFWNSCYLTGHNKYEYLLPGYK